MNNIILKELEKLEKENNIRILFAVESGSRAWGFAGTDSDYDVRFVYIRDKNDYLKLDGIKDTIELPINDELDINGWDVTKFLRLLYASNPSVFEWINSPIIYKKYFVFDKIIEVAKKYFDEYKIINHYLHIGENHYSNYIDGKEEINVKKYFYILRSIAAARYVLKNCSIPPIVFDELRNDNIPSEYNLIINDLLEIKKNNDENKTIVRNEQLDKFIITSFDEIKSRVEGLKKKTELSWDELNAIFINLL